MTENLTAYTTALLQLADQHTNQDDPELSGLTENLRAVLAETSNRDLVLVAAGRLSEHLVEQNYATEYDLPQLSG